MLLLAGFWLLVLGSRLYGQPKVGEQISVWRTLVPILDEPPQRFYAKLYQSLKASLQDRLADTDSSGQNTPVEVVLTGMGFGPHRLFAAPSLFAERPLYLLVRYKHLRCYVYAGQTPTGLFISSWGYSDFEIGEQNLLAVTKRALNYFRKQTLFQYDAALMFTHCVHEIISDTVNGYLQEEGLKPLEAMERRPILHAFYQNPFHQNPLFPNLFSRDQPSQQATSPQAPLFDLHHTSTGSVETESGSSGTASDSSNHSQTHASTQSPSTQTPRPPASPASPSSTPEPLFPMDEWMSSQNPPHQNPQPESNNEDAPTIEGEGDEP